MAEVTLLKTRDLTRHFDGLKAVEAVDFELKQGAIHAIIGPNGAGKSTFVSLLSGRIPATRGTVEFGGEDVSKLPAHMRVRRGIAYTFQITNIYGSMTVMENIAVAVQNRLNPHIIHRKRVHEAEIEREAAKAATAVGLGDRLNEVAGTLAYGHQRLLEVAMGLALEPKLLILDEPTQGLSDAEIENFKAVARKVNETATVLLIEHNMGVVMALADKITVLDQGQVLAQGTPDQITNDAAVQAAYLGASV